MSVLNRISSTANCVTLGGLVAVALLMTACKSNKLYESPKVSSFRRGSLPVPPGMVYIPAGTIFYKSSQDSSNVGKNVSVSAFFMDETEVTNKQYREFINWVADSVAVVDYIQDDRYFLETSQSDAEDMNKEAGERFINWNAVKKESPLWRSKNPEIQEKLQPMLTSKAGKRVLNSALLNYRFSYIKMDGRNNDQYVTDTVGVMPIEDVWSTDFPNAQMKTMDDNYFYHKSFDHNPVVGVTWKQARAYADWRGKQMMANLQKNSYLRGLQLTFSLPTEAQWQYAAEGKLDPLDTIQRTRLTIKDRKSDKKKLAINFKQGEGTYSRDGSTFTVPVKAYTPNAFGVYNMAGNVSEWTLDAFSPSSVEFVHDLNPVLLYDANDKDSYTLKRKVVRGGSWKDNGSMLNTDVRNYEQQDEAHSYIGFRCVISAFDMVTPQIKTRRYKN